MLILERVSILTIKHTYDDDKTHIHAIAYGGGTQSTALLLMALKGEINGVIPEFIIFSDTGWETKKTYAWIAKVNDYIERKFNKRITFTNGGNIREDVINGALHGTRFASLPFYTRDDFGEKGMTLRQCSTEYKVFPVNKKIRELLGYKNRQRVKETVHLWKGISTDEIQRVKPAKAKWQIAEHPLVDIVDIDRSGCVAYVEREGLGTPAKSSCIGCPYHNAQAWREMKMNDKESWLDAVEVDNIIRRIPDYKGTLYLHRAAMPLEEVEMMEGQMDLDLFNNECEGMCGL